MHAAGGDLRGKLVAAERAVDLASTIDLPSPSWVDAYRESQWKPLRPIYNTSLWPQECASPHGYAAARTANAGSLRADRAGADCEGIDALQMLFHGHGGGVSLELGGLDGIQLSESKQ